MSSESERRLSKLEEAMRASRQGMVVLLCDDGDQHRAARDYLAKIPEDEQPEMVVVVRRFTRDVGEPQVLHAMVGGKPAG